MYLASIMEVEGSIPTWNSPFRSNAAYWVELIANKPFPSCCLSLVESESWCWAIQMIMSLICMKIHNSFPFEWLCTRTLFETEVNSNSEMGYCLALMAPAIWFAAIIWMLCTERDIMMSVDSLLSFMRRSFWYLSNYLLLSVTTTSPSASPLFKGLATNITIKGLFVRVLFSLNFRNRRPLLIYSENPMAELWAVGKVIN